jgi:hypothetical protein
MSTLNGQGSGDNPLAATADWNLKIQSAGVVLVADGFGNVAGSGVQLSALGGGGSPGPAGPQGPQGPSGITRAIQTLRVPYTPSTTDQNNYYANVPITFPTAFADTNYSVSVTLELDATQYPTWAANATLALGYSIIDSNGMIQQVTTAGTTGATEPTWTTGPTYSGATTDGTVTWTVYDIGSFSYYNGAKSKTAVGFIAELSTYDANTLDSTPLVLSVLAVHD